MKAHLIFRVAVALALCGGIWAATPPSAPPGQSFMVVTDTNGNLTNPTNFLTKNVLQGTGVTFTTNGAKITISAAAGTGNVNGPGSSIDGSIVVFSGTTGKLVADGSSLLANVTNSLNTKAATNHVHDYATLTGVPATFPPDTHTHPASDITAGQLSLARGGTGLDTSAASNGQLLIGNGAGWTRASLTAGANVTITPGSGTITIASTAGTGTIIGTLNGLTGSNQTFSVGTAGTDFAITSSGTNHAFNLPTATAGIRGALSSGDWTMFNNKADASHTHAYSSLTGIPSTFAPSAHNHAASEINSGQLSPARGGTGIDASAAANGEVLIGNGSGFTKTTLTAGANITITPGAGSITIASTGGGGGGSGIGTINGLTGTNQTMTVGTSGTDFAIVDSGTNHAFNLPTASASNRGALASADWSTFNGKLGSLNGLTPATQVFSVGTSGTDFGITSASSTHTFNIPSASASNRGLVTSGDWSGFNAKVSPGRTITAGSGLSGGGDLSADRTISLASTSAAILSAVSDESGSGVIMGNNTPTIITPAIQGAVNFPAGTRQTFAPNTTTPGLNVGTVASDPSSLSSGDVWVNSTSTRARARLGSTTYDVATGGQYDLTIPAITSGASIAIDLNSAQYQTLTLSHDATLTTTGRPSTGGRATTIFVTASGTHTLTINGSWVNFAETNVVGIANGKNAFLTLLATGSTESDVKVSFGIQP